MQSLGERIGMIWRSMLVYLGSPAFYIEIGIIAVALGLAWLLARFLANRAPIFRDEPQPGPVYELRSGIYRARILLLPVLAPLLSVSPFRSASISPARRGWCEARTARR